MARLFVSLAVFGVLARQALADVTCKSALTDASGNCVAQGCQRWSDGCNACTVMWGDLPTLQDCTERACFAPGTAQCVDAAGGTGAAACSYGQYTKNGVCTKCDNYVCTTGKYRSGTCSGTTNEYVCTACSNPTCPAGEYQRGTCSGSHNGFTCSNDPSVMDKLRMIPALSTFVAAITAAGYDRSLGSTYSTKTVFAPTNDAFAKIKNLDKILADKPTLQKIIREHYVNTPYKGTPIFSSDIEDGMVVRASLGQGLKLYKTCNSYCAYKISNIDGTSFADVVEADIKASGSVIHQIDTVLIPIVAGASGTACPTKLGPCTADTNPVTTCHYKPENFNPAENCKISTLKVWSYGGTCCTRQCEYRKGGTGDVCRPTSFPTRLPPTYTTPPVTTTGADDKPCPTTCKDTMKSCLGKGYSTANCLEYARKGYLCKGADGKSLPCSAQGILPAANTPTCPDIQKYTTCGGCQATCENPNPICTMMCHVGCFCPRDTPLFDDAQGKCITADLCPAANACEGSIKADYLDSGNVPTKCTGTASGAVCESKCASATCVPRKNFPGGDKLAAICAKFSEADCGQKQNGAKHCEWAGAVPEGSSGPTFVCSTADDGDTAWAIQDEGECSAGGGVADSVCDFLAETDCLDKGACSSTLQQKCSPLVKNTFNTCKATCFAASHKDQKCGGCLIDQLFESNTLGLEQPDIFTCCGCLDDTFSAVNIDKAQLHDLLASPCKKHSPTNDDDDKDDMDD